MDFKSHARFMLELVRKNTQQQFDTLASPEEWFYQPVSDSNHAMWIMGHLAMADNRFAWRFREETHVVPDGFADLFWIGTTPSAEPSAYPSIDAVKDYFVDRRQNLMRVIEELSEDELTAPMPEVDPTHPLAAAPTKGSWLLYAAAHEMTHVGQLTVCRRGLGQNPLR